MTQTNTGDATTPTLAEWAERLGGIPQSRIVRDPAPGTAKESDIADQIERKDRACELIDYTLVEKAMGIRKSAIIVNLARILGEFVDAKKIGEMGVEPGSIALRPGLVLIPDIALFLNPRDASHPAPNLCVGILSISNTKRESELHREYYFAAGTRCYWQIDPSSRTIAVFSSATASTLLKLADTLGNAEMLPGFQLPVKELFESLERRAK